LSRSDKYAGQMLIANSSSKPPAAEATRSGRGIQQEDIRWDDLSIELFRLAFSQLAKVTV
jgi:hypothetical protein